MQEVNKWCVAADPHRAEHWCQVSKDIANWRKRTPKSITQQVPEKLPIPVMNREVY